MQQLYANYIGAIGAKKNSTENNFRWRISALLREEWPLAFCFALHSSFDGTCNTIY